MLNQIFNLNKIYNMKIKEYFFLIFNIFLYALSIKRVGDWTIFRNDFQIPPEPFSELLIYYPNQFVRRGLIGQIIRTFDQDGILFDTAVLIIYINFILFSILLFLNIWYSNYSEFQHFLIIFSTFGIFHMSSYKQYFYRKELFILSIFLLINFILKFRKYPFLTFLIIGLLTSLAILIHEGVALLMFPFVAYQVKIMFSNKNFYKYFLYFCSIIFLLVIINSGNAEISNKIRSSLSIEDLSLIEQFSSSSEKMDGIAWIGKSIFDTLELSFVLVFSGSILLWSVYLFLLIYGLIIITGINYQSFNWNNIYKFLTNNKLFLLIPIIFIIAMDWGRWILVLFYFSVFTLSSADKYNKLTNINLQFLIYALASFLTIMPECCLQMSKLDIIFVNLKNIFT